MSEYPSFAKVYRSNNLYCYITEKVDGTNGLIEVYEPFIDSNHQHVRMGSRNRYLSTSDDNQGFANYFLKYSNDIIGAWYQFLEEEGNQNDEFPLKPPYRIYGEWFGKGIQRNYGLDQKWFMPFSKVWYYILGELAGIPGILPPYEFYKGTYKPEVVDECMNRLKTEGSKVVPGYMNPEGIVIHFINQNFRLKETFDGAKYLLDVHKEEHDEKPVKEKSPICITCGKRKYLNKLTDLWECRNYHCEFGKQNLERLKNESH